MPDERTVSSISVQTEPTKINYTRGEALDLTGGVLLVTYSDGNITTVEMTDPGVISSGYNAQVGGEQIVTIYYSGKSTELAVYVQIYEWKLIARAPSGGVGEWLDEEHTIERFNDYELNTSDMDYDHICGWSNVSDSESEYGGFGCNLFYGSSNGNYGYQARDNLIGGNSNTNRGYSNMLGGQSNTNTGNKNVIAGQNNTVSANDSIVAGQYNTVAGSYEIVSGIRNNVSGGYNQQGNIVNGNGNTISGSQNIVNGNTINTSASRSLIVGQGHSGYGDMAIVCGNGASINSLYYLMIGNNGNIFTVDTSGNVGAAGQYGTIGADYAEFFEWEDGNPDSEYMRGILVALDGDKIIPAQGDDFIGIISDNPAVLGNMTPDKLDDPKFAPVGLIGRLVVRDNGTCRPNGYVSARDGIAVASIRKTSARVLRRIDETHVEVLLK